MAKEKKEEILEWTKKINDWSDHFWGKGIFENKDIKRQKPSPYIGTVIINAILIYIFNNLLNWHLSWLTGTFVIALWIFNISFGTAILLNLIYLAYNAKWFRTAGQLLLNILSFGAISALYQTFPFTVSMNVEYWIQLTLSVLIICILISIIVEIVKLLSYAIRFIFVRN